MIGRNGAAPAEVPDPARENEADTAPATGDDETLAERDQTRSDKDQTRSAKDQSLGDIDQQAADEDQAISDADASNDEVSATHERTTAVRESTTREREDVSRSRDDTATERDEAARSRDELAAQRDRDAELADQRGLELDGSGESANVDLLRMQELRAQDVKRRQRAQLDRERAARDREQAARDREQAARDREQAKLDRELAGTDDLTGARRRGVGINELEREIERTRRMGGNLVAVFVDVDGLKRVNDTLGHPAGDELLREVVKMVKHHMRSYDLVVRIGGDEFLCVLPDVSVDDARQRFDALNAELQAGPAAGSVSIGLAELRDGEGSADLIRRADSDLLSTRKAARASL